MLASTGAFLSGLLCSSARSVYGHHLHFLSSYKLGVLHPWSAGLGQASSNAILLISYLGQSQVKSFYSNVCSNLSS